MKFIIWIGSLTVLRILNAIVMSIISAFAGKTIILGLIPTIFVLGVEMLISCFFVSLWDTRKRRINKDYIINALQKGYPSLLDWVTAEVPSIVIDECKKRRGEKRALLKYLRYCQGENMIQKIHLDVLFNEYRKIGL